MNNAHIDVVKDNMKNLWQELLEIMKNVKESAAQFTNPNLLAEHLQVIFRDESKWSKKILTNFFLIWLRMLFSCSRAK